MSQRDREKRKPRTDKAVSSSLQQAQERQAERVAPEREPAVHAATSLQDSLGNQALLGAIRGAEQDGVTTVAAEAMDLSLAGVDTQEMMPGTGSMSVMRAQLHAELRERAGLEAPESSLVSRIGRRRGRPLPPAVRARMEQAFGHDFDHVRVHTDPEAARTARELEAHAFAADTDIWFGPGEFAPETPQGEHLLAHELAHVVQADQGKLRPTGAGLQVSDPSDHSELEAESMARQAVSRMAQLPDLASAPARLPVDMSIGLVPTDNKLDTKGSDTSAKASAEVPSRDPASPAPSAMQAVQRKARKGGRPRKQDSPATMQPEDLASAIAGVIAKVLPEDEGEREEQDAQVGGPPQGREGPQGRGPADGGAPRRGDRRSEPATPGERDVTPEEELSPLDRLEGVLEGAIPVPVPEGTELLPEQLGQAFEALGEDTQQRIVGLAEDRVPKADELLEGVDIDSLTRGAEVLDDALQAPEDLLAKGADLAQGAATDALGGIDPSLGALNLGIPELYHDKGNKQLGGTPGLDQGLLGFAPGQGSPKLSGAAPGTASPSPLKGPASSAQGTPTSTDAKAKDPKKKTDSTSTDADDSAASSEKKGKDEDKQGAAKKKDAKGGGGKDVKPMSQKEIKSEIKRLERKKGYREIDVEILDLDLNTHQTSLDDKQGRIGRVQAKQERTDTQTQKRKALLSLKQQKGGGGPSPDSDNKLSFLGVVAARLPKQLSKLQGTVDKIQGASTKVTDEQTTIQDEIATIDEELQALYDQLKSGGGGGGTGNPDVPKTCENLEEDLTKELEKQEKNQEKSAKAEKELTVRLEELEATIGEKNSAVSDFDTELGTHRSELETVEGKITAQKAKLDAKKAADAKQGKGKGKATKGTTTTTSTASDTSTKGLKTRKGELGKLVKGVARKRKAALRARDAAKKEEDQKKLRLKEKQDEIKERDKKLGLIKKALDTLVKPTIHFNIISKGVGVKVRMAWLPKDARPWEEGDEDLSDADREAKDKQWTEQSKVEREKGLAERKQQREAAKLQAQSLEVASGQKKRTAPGQGPAKPGEMVLVREGSSTPSTTPKKKESPEEEAKRKKLEEDNLIRQIGLARDMAPDKREQLLTQLAKNQKPRPRNEEQVKAKIAELNLKFDTKMTAVDGALNTTLAGQYPGKIPAAKLEEIAGKLEGVSVEDLKRRNENLKRKEFQAKAAAYLGFDTGKDGAGLEAQDVLFRLGKDRGLNAHGMLQHIQFMNPRRAPEDLMQYMPSVQRAKRGDQEYQKNYGGNGQAQKALRDKMRNEVTKKEAKHQDNLRIADNLGIQPLEVDSYVKTLCDTTGINEREARRQFREKGPAGYDPSKDAPVPADLAAKLQAIHTIPDATKRKQALDAIMKKMPPKALLGALMRAGEVGIDGVRGPTANEALRTQVKGIEGLPEDKQWEAYCGLSDMTGMPFRDLRLAYKNKNTKEQALNGASGILNNKALTTAERDKRMDELAERLKLTKEQLKKAYTDDIQRTEEALAGYKDKDGPWWTPNSPLHKHIEELETKGLEGDALKVKLEEIARLTGVPIERLKRYHATKFRAHKDAEYAKKTGMPEGKAYDQLLKWSRQSNCTPDEFLAHLRNASWDQLPPEMKKAKANLLNWDRANPDKGTSNAVKLAKAKREAGLYGNEKVERLLTDPDDINKLPPGPEKTKALMDYLNYRMKVNTLISELDETIVDDDEAYAKLKAFTPKERAALVADRTLYDEDNVPIYKSFLDGCNHNPHQKWGKRLWAEGKAYNALLNSGLQEKVAEEKKEADAIIGRGLQNAKLAANLGGADATGKKTPIPVTDANAYVDAYAAAHKISRDQAMAKLSHPPEGQTAKDMIGAIYQMDIEPATGKKSGPNAALKAELTRVNAMPAGERDAALLRLKSYTGLTVKDFEQAQDEVVQENHIVKTFAAVEMMPKSEQDKALRKLAEDLGIKPGTPAQLQEIKERYTKAMGAATQRYEATIQTNPVIKDKLAALTDPSKCPASELQSRVAAMARILNMPADQLLTIIKRKRFLDNEKSGALDRWGGGTPKGRDEFLAAAHKHHMTPEQFADHLTRAPAGSLGPFAKFKLNVDVKKDQQLTEAEQKARKAALGDPNDPNYIQLHKDLVSELTGNCSDDKILALLNRMTPAQRAMFVREYERDRKNGTKIDGDPLPPLREAFYDALQGSDEDKGIDLLNAAEEYNAAGVTAKVTDPVDIHDKSPGGYANKRDALFDELQSPGGPSKAAVKWRLMHMTPAERAMFMKEYAQLREGCSAQVDQNKRKGKEIPKDLNVLFKGDHGASVMLADAAKFRADPIADAAAKKANALVQEIEDTDKFIRSTNWKGDRQQAYKVLVDMAKQNGQTTSNMARFLNKEAPRNEKDSIPPHIRAQIKTAPSQVGGTWKAMLLDAEGKLSAKYGVAKQPGDSNVLGGLELRKGHVQSHQAKLEGYLDGKYMSQKDVVDLLYGCNSRELAALDAALKSRGGLKALISGRKSSSGYAMAGIGGEKKIELLALVKKGEDYRANAKDDQLVLDLKQGDPRATAPLDQPGGLADRLAWMKDLPPTHRVAKLAELQQEMIAKGRGSIGEQMMQAYFAGTMGGDKTLITTAMSTQVEAAKKLPETEREAFMAQLAGWGGYDDAKALTEATEKSTTNLKAAAEYQRIKKLPPSEQVEKLNELSLKYRLSEGELDTLLATALENGMLKEPKQEVPEEVNARLDEIKNITDQGERITQLKALAKLHDITFTDLIAHVNKKNADERKKREQLTVARRQAEDLRQKLKSGDREAIKRCMEKYAQDPEAFQRLLKEYPEGADALKKALKATLNRTNTTHYARKAINFVGGLFGAKPNPYGANDPDYVDFMNLIDKAEKFEPTPDLPTGITDKDSRLLQEIIKTNSDRDSKEYTEAVEQFKLMKGLNDSDFAMVLAHAEHGVKHFDQAVTRHHFALASEVRGSLLWTDTSRIKTLVGRMSHQELAALYERDPDLVNDALASVGGDVKKDFTNKLDTAKKAAGKPFEDREKYISERRVAHKAKYLRKEFDAWFSPDRDRIRELLKDCTPEELKMLNDEFGKQLQDKIDEAMQPTWFEAAVAVIAIVAVSMIPGVGLLAAGALTAYLGTKALGMGKDPETIAVKARLRNATDTSGGKYKKDPAKVRGAADKLRKAVTGFTWFNDGAILSAIGSLNPAELMELDKLMKLPPPQGIEVTDKDGKRLDLSGLIKKHLDGDEKAVAMALMQEAQDAVGGRNRRQELKDACRSAAITERMKELRKDPRHAKKSSDEIYKLVMADPKALNNKIKKKEKKIKDSANTLFKAIDGWGDDEKTVLKTLATLTPEEIELVKVEYRRHFGKDLETQMREDMGLGDWKPGEGFEAGGWWTSHFTDQNEGRIALMMMDKKHRVEGLREMLLEYSDRAMFEDEDLIFNTLEKMTVAERTKLVSGFEGQHFLDRVKEDLGTNEAALVDAITEINEKTGKADANPAHIAAVRMKMAIHGSGDWWDFSSWGTEEDDFLKELDKLTPAQVQEAISYYNTHLAEDGGFMQEVIDDFSVTSPEFQVIDAEVRGDKVAADAWRLEYAADGWGTDEKLIEETLKAAREGRGGRTKEHFARLKNRFEMEFGQEGGEYHDSKGTGQSALQIMLGDEMEGLERVFFEQLAEKGEADPELELAYAMSGWGTDEERAKKILEKVSKMSPNDRAIFALKFEALSRDVLGVNETLEEWVEGDFSGTEGFEMKLLLMGEPRTPQEYLERARMRYDFERSGFINGIGNVFMDSLEAMGAHSHGSLLQKHMGEVESMFGPDGKLEDPDKFEDLKELCDWQTQDAKNYREVRDKATNYVVTAIQAIGAVVCMIIPGGQAFGAAWIAYLVKFAASMAVTAVSMLAKQALAGNGYGWEEAGVDLAQGVLEAATAGLGGMREFQKAAAKALAVAKGLVAEGAERTFKHVAKEALEEAVTGGAQSLISGVITSEKVWEGGGEGELFKHLLKETAMGALKSGGMSFVGEGMKKTPWGKRLEKIEQSMGEAGPKPNFLKQYGLKYVNEVATATVGTALDHNKWEAWAKGEGFNIDLLKGLFIDPAWKGALQTKISRSSSKRHKEASMELGNAQRDLVKYKAMLRTGESDMKPATLRRLIATAEDTIQTKQVLMRKLEGEAVDEVEDAIAAKERQIKQGRDQLAGSDIDVDEIGSKTEHVAIRKEVGEGMDAIEDQTRVMRRKVAEGEAVDSEPETRKRRPVDDTSSDTDDALGRKTRKLGEGEAKPPRDQADGELETTSKPTRRSLEPQELEDGTKRFVVFDNYEQVAGKKAAILGAKALGDDGDFSPELKAKLEKLGYTVRKNNLIARADTGAQVPLHLEGGRIVAGLKVSGKSKTPTHLANELLPGGSRGAIWKRAKGMVGQEITTADGRVVKVAKVVPTVVREGVDSEGQALTGRRIAIMTEDGQTLYRPVSDFTEAQDRAKAVTVKTADDVETKPVIRALARGDASELTGGDPSAATQVFGSPAVRKAVNKHFEDAPDAPAERRKQVKNLLDGFGGDFMAAHTSFDTVESKAVKKALNEHRGRLVGSLMAEVQAAFPGLKVNARRLDPDSPAMSFEFEGAETSHARAFLEQAAQDLFGGSLKRSLGVELSEGPVRLKADADVEAPRPRRVQGEFNDPISYEEDGVTKYFSDGKGGKWGYSTSFGFAGEVAQDGAFVIRQKVVLVSDDVDDPAVQRVMADVHAANDTYYNDPKHRIVVDDVERPLRQVLDVEIVTKQDLADRQSAKQKAAADAAAKGEAHDPGIEPTVVNVHKGTGRADSSNLYTEGPDTPADDKYRQMVIAHEFAHAIWGLADRYEDGARQLENPSYDPATDPPEKQFINIRSESRKNASALHVSHEGGLMEDFNVAYAQGKQPIPAAKSWEDLAQSSWKGLKAIYDESNKDMPVKAGGREYDWGMALKRLNPHLANEDGGFPATIPAGSEVVLPKLTAPEGFGVSEGNLQQLAWHIAASKQGQVKFELGDGSVADQVVQAEKSKAYAAPKQRYSKGVVSKAKSFGFDTDSLAPDAIDATRGRAKQRRPEAGIVKSKGGALPTGADKTEIAGPKGGAESMKALKPGTPVQQGRNAASGAKPTVDDARVERAVGDKDIRKLLRQAKAANSAQLLEQIEGYRTRKVQALVDEALDIFPNLKISAKPKPGDDSTMLVDFEGGATSDARAFFAMKAELAGKDFAKSLGLELSDAAVKLQKGETTDDGIGRYKDMVSGDYDDPVVKLDAKGRSLGEIEANTGFGMQGGSAFSFDGDIGDDGAYVVRKKILLVSDGEGSTAKVKEDMLAGAQAAFNDPKHRIVVDGVERTLRVELDIIEASSKDKVPADAKGAHRFEVEAGAGGASTNALHERGGSEISDASRRQSILAHELGHVVFGLPDKYQVDPKGKTKERSLIDKILFRKAEEQTVAHLHRMDDDALYAIQDGSLMDGPRKKGDLIEWSAEQGDTIESLTEKVRSTFEGDKPQEGGPNWRELIENANPQLRDAAGNFREPRAGEKLQLPGRTAMPGAGLTSHDIEYIQWTIEASRKGWVKWAMGDEGVPDQIYGRAKAELSGDTPKFDNPKLEALHKQVLASREGEQGTAVKPTAPAPEAAPAPAAPGLRRRAPTVDAEDGEDLDRFFSPSEPKREQPRQRVGRKTMKLPAVQDDTSTASHDARTRMMPAVDPTAVARATGHDPRNGPLVGATKAAASQRTKATVHKVMGRKRDDLIRATKDQHGGITPVNDDVVRTKRLTYGFQGEIDQDGTYVVRKAIQLVKKGGDVAKVKREMQAAVEEHFNQPGHQLTVDGVKRQMRVVIDFIDDVKQAPDNVAKRINVLKGRGRMNSGNYFDDGSTAPSDLAARKLVLAHELGHAIFGLTDNYRDSGKHEGGAKNEVLVSKHRHSDSSLYRVKDGGLMDGPGRKWNRRTKRKVASGQTWQKLAKDYAYGLEVHSGVGHPSSKTEKLSWYAKALDALPILGKLRKEKRHISKLIPYLQHTNPHLVDPSTGRPRALRTGDEIVVPMKTAKPGVGLTQENIDQISWAIGKALGGDAADYHLGDGQLPDQLMRRAKQAVDAAKSNASGDDWDAAFRTQAAIDNAQEGRTGARITQKLPIPTEAKDVQAQPKGAKTSKLPKRHHDEVPDADTPTMVMKAFDPKQTPPRQVTPAALSDLLPAREAQALSGGDAGKARALFSDPARRRAVADGVSRSEHDRSARQRIMGDLLQGFGGDFRAAHASFGHGDTAAVTQALERHRVQQLQRLVSDLKRAYPEVTVTTRRVSVEDPTLRIGIEGGQAHLAQAFLRTTAGLHHGGDLARSLGVELDAPVTGLMPPLMRADHDEVTLEVPGSRRHHEAEPEITAPMPEVTAPMPAQQRPDPEQDLQQARGRASSEPSPEQLEAFRRNNINYDFHDEDTTALLAKRPELRALVQEHGLTHEEVVALYAYTRQDYADINMGLRGQDDDQLAAYRAQIEITAAAMDKLPNFRGPVFRRADAGDWLDAYQPGATVNEKAFTSTSIEYDTQLGSSGHGKVEFVIKSRTGKDITQLSGKGELENEVLFGPATRFTVAERKVDSDGTIVIYMDEAPQRAKPGAEEMLPAPAPGALKAPAPEVDEAMPRPPAASGVEDSPVPAAPRGGKRARVPGPEDLDLDNDDRTTLVKAGLTKKEANRIIAHREMTGGTFDLDDFVALNPNVNARLLSKLARVAGRQDEAVEAAQRIGETEAEAAQRIGLDPMDYGRRVEVQDVADVHDHFKGVLGAEDWSKLMFPDLQDDPGRAASETIALLRKAYDPDMNEDAAELYEPHKLPATRKILDILEGSDAEQDPARTLQRVLTASGEMPFDFTYDPRGLLIDQLKAGGRAEDFVEATVLRLKAQGITYAELQGKLSTPGVDPETFAEIGKRHGVVIRMLPHLLTHQFAEGGGGFDPAKLQALLFGKDADIHGNVPDMVGGLDICGPESGSWDKLGMERLGDVYAVLQRHALLSDRTLVLRPHVGEGYSGTEGQRRHGVEQDSKQGRVAQDNLDLILTQLSKMKKDKLYAQPPEGKVEIRLGHVTQATEAQVAKMKELGVIAEVNIGSNLVTGALGRSNEPGGSRLDQHPLLMLLYHDVHTLLSTDAGGVMSTDMAKEYGFAADILDRFRAGKTSITVPDPKNPKDGIVLKYADLPAEVQKRFHVEHLERTAKAYARLGSMRHNVEDGYMGDARAPRVLRKNASAKAKALGERYAQESDAEDAALSRNLDSAVIERMTPEERIEHLRSQLSALEALDATAGSLGPGMTGPSRAEVRRMVVELRTELLRDFERQLRTKHPGATIQSTSAGSDRLEIRVVDTPEPTEAAEALKQLGTKLLGEKWLAMLGIKLTTPADTNADKR